MLDLLFVLALAGTFVFLLERERRRHRAQRYWWALAKAFEEPVAQLAGSYRYLGVTVEEAGQAFAMFAAAWAKSVKLDEA